MENVLTCAMALHQAGDLTAAAELYQQALAEDRDNVDALHMLGLIHHQRRDHARAIELIVRAVALQPNVPAFHANLSEVYRGLGQYDRAIGCCRAALRLWPDYPEALSNYGLALQGKGCPAEAADKLRRALELQPAFAAAHNNLGVVLRELGEFDEALQHFRKSVELDPNYAPAQTNLGQSLLDRGLPAEALPHCEKATQLDPDNAALHHNLGNVLRGVDRLVDARVAYLEALRLSPDLAVSHAHLGLVLRGEGKFQDAVVWLTQAAELEPENAQFWQYLAEVHQDLEEHAAAIPCWEKVMALGAENCAARLGLGWAVHEENRWQEARQHYSRAFELQPDSGMAQINLGGIHEEQGELAEAEAAFRNALRLQPRFALPHARLATLLRGGLPDADLAALEDRLADADLGQGPRARLLFGLAHVLDARGNFSRAAACLREANSISRTLNRERNNYDPVQHSQFVDALLQSFDGEFYTRFSGQGSNSCRPVFVFGLPRSGTTLVEQVLASHSLVHAAGELRLARMTFEAIPRVVGRKVTPRECVANLDTAALEHLAQLHLEQLQSIDGGRSVRIVDKMPDNYLYLGLLAVLFPKATFIHCRRDLRDVVLSCWMTDFRSIRWADEPAHLTSRVHEYTRVMDHWRAVLPIPVHEIGYESMIDDFEDVARRLVATCQLDWEPSCLEFYRTKRTVRTASVVQVRQPLYRSSKARWKNYRDELADLFAALQLCTD